MILDQDQRVLFANSPSDHVKQAAVMSEIDINIAQVKVYKEESSDGKENVKRESLWSDQQPGSKKGKTDVGPDARETEINEMLQDDRERMQYEEHASQISDSLMEVCDFALTTQAVEQAIASEIAEEPLSSVVELGLHVRQEDEVKEFEAQEYDVIGKTRSLKRSLSLQSALVIESEVVGESDQVVG
jgi:hypothetical protein